MKDSRWYVVRNMAYILGLMKDPKGVKYLKELVKHEEPRVRREAIRALGAIGDLESRNLLVGFLESPDALVRIPAARVLASLREKRALPILLKLIEGKELPNRDGEEKKAIFEAIGQLGSDDLLLLLQKILFRREILQRRKTEEMREGAALALALMGTAGARKILQDGTKGKDRAVALACRSALSEASRLSMRGGEEE
jgi:HEAT repeat protein